MTLLEIYNTVISIVYGDPTASPPPVHEVARIQDDILYQHHAVQTDYNYWFMYLKTTLDLVTGTYTYALPDDYKALVLLDTDKTVEMLGNDLYFSDENITEDESIRFDYWKYFETPTWTDAYTDDVTTRLHWVIIYTIASNLLLKRGDIQSSQVHGSKADEAKTLAQNEDYYRRQDCKTVW